MYARPRLLILVIFVVGLILHLVVQRWFALSYRMPRILTLTAVTIGLRWGSVAGGFLGGVGGLILALFSGEPPFAGTAAMAAAGWVAGEIPSRFALESHKVIGLSVAFCSWLELALVFLMRAILPADSLNALIWVTGWSVIFGPPLYWLAVWLSTPPPTQRLPTEPE